MKSIVLCALFLIASGPALAEEAAMDRKPPQNKAERMRQARERRKARLAAMSPDELAAERARLKEAQQEDRRRRVKAVADRYAAAKAARPDCYRVVATNGVPVAMTRAEYDSHMAKRAKRKIKARRIGPPARDKGKPKARNIDRLTRPRRVRRESEN